MAMSANPGSYEGEPSNAAEADPQSGESLVPAGSGSSTDSEARPPTTTPKVPNGTGPTGDASDTETGGADPQPEAATSAPDETGAAPEREEEDTGPSLVAEVLDEPEVLPCGQPLDELWDRWTEDPSAAHLDPHVANCPHCTTALGELRLLDEFVRQEIERDERAAAHTPTTETGRITDRVMDIVRTELRPGPSVPLGERGEDYWITETAAARTFRAAAEGESGVQAGSCRIAPVDGTERRFAMPGSRLPRLPLRVRISIVAPLRLHTPVPDIASRVRDRVSAAASDELGMEISAVDVVVVDVRDETEEGTL